MYKLNLNKKRIMALGMSAIALTSVSGLTGCSKKDKDSTVDASISSTADDTNGLIQDFDNLDSTANYCLISFDDTIQVIKYKSYQMVKDSLIDIHFNDKDFIRIDTANVLFFDINSKEQVDLVNEILMNNEKETIPYVKVR